MYYTLYIYEWLELDGDIVVYILSVNCDVSNLYRYNFTKAFLVLPLFKLQSMDKTVYKLQHVVGLDVTTLMAIIFNLHRSRKEQWPIVIQRLVRFQFHISIGSLCTQFPSICRVVHLGQGSPLRQIEVDLLQIESCSFFLFGLERKLHFNIFKCILKDKTKRLASEKIYVIIMDGYC